MIDPQNALPKRHSSIATIHAVANSGRYNEESLRAMAALVMRTDRAEWSRRHGVRVKNELSPTERAEIKECFTLLDGESADSAHPAVPRASAAA